ncbi:MAG: DNA polymerase III subunit alpha [Thermodesulfobacteriota bacterium]
MTDFTHLHCHTEYSLLDGAIRLGDLCSQAVDYGFSSAAITDHGNLFGALDFYLTAKQYGIKPIIGCEVYVAPGDRRTKHTDKDTRSGYHLVLLAQNLEGYYNLVRLVSRGWLEGFHYKPRVDKSLLAQHNAGLIALSACLKGEVPYVMRHEGMDRGKAIAEEYSQLFPDRFYLEVQANGIPEQERLNAQLLDLAETARLPLVATNDCHYLSYNDVEAHDILLCIQTNAQYYAKERMRFNTQELYYRPPEEMEQAFSHCPQALENVGHIAQRCNVELDLKQNYFPVYEVPEGRTLEEEFIHLVREGLRTRLSKLPYEVEEQRYWQRLDTELEVICAKGFPAYFLIVQDFINWAKKQGIPVGPGRGSAAGSLVAYCLGITNLDPLRYNLLFERFLNVERASMPDIDVDFCYNRREEVIRYVTEKYGKNSVAQITTFGTMKAKAVVRDVGRALGLSFAETDKIAKLVPDDLKMTIDKALEQEPDLAALAENDPTVDKLIDVSRRLEGLARHASTHAAGIVISDSQPLENHLPLYLGKKGEVVTQFDMKKVEKVGLIKFDFLGLKTLTVIADTLQLATQAGKTVPDIDTLPLDDKATFALLCRTETDGVFQLESSGMRNVMKDLQPTSFEDVIALLALYRPGPLESGMVTDFIRRKHGEIPVEYPHPLLEPVLQATHGVILYQEQVMRIASDLANYSLGDGDILRRAMGKKDPAVMAEQRTKFVNGAQENGIDQETATYIFDLMEKFAGYGFNKSHSAAYALVSYQTAYLKAHYPVEFMAALITSEVSNTDKVIAHVNACREMGIEVLPPDVNKSERHFTVEEEKLRFGLSGVKNVGGGAIEALVAERKQNGPYASLLDFCKRIGSRKVTKRVLESLIKAGAMDSLGCSRAALLASLDKVVATAQRQSRDKSFGQLSLMAMMGDEENCVLTGIGMDIEEAQVAEWDDEKRLQFEKEALGFFLSGHPLLRFREELKRQRLLSLQECGELNGDTEVQTAVLVTGVKEHVTKKGGRMAFCQIEDLTGTGEMTMFPETYAKVRNGLDLEQPLVVKAKMSSYEGGNSAGAEEGAKQIKLVAQEVGLLTDQVGQGDEPVRVDIDVSKLQEKPVQELKYIIGRYPGQAPIQLGVGLEQAECVLQLGPNYRVSAGPDFWSEIRKWQDAHSARP